MTWKIRIGRIEYTNVWPIFFHFPQERFERELELLTQVPTELNRALQQGTVDISAISSFAYGQSFDDYLLFPDLSVSAFGRVGSILLFHDKPLEQIANGTISLTTASATTVNLLKIIMTKFYDGNPDYRSAAPNLDEMMRNADAALLIGDDAIRASRANTRYTVTDLGELWNRHTGRWMTYAVWALRKEAAQRHPELIARVFDAFVDSKRQSTADRLPMVREAVRQIGGSVAYWEQYFSRLCYDFGPEQWSGLDLYFQYAWELELLDRPVPIRIWESGAAPLQVKE